MRWFLQHIDQFTAPFGILLGLISAFFSYETVQRRKRGLPPKPWTEARKAFFGILMAVFFTFAGVLIAHKFS